MSPPEISSELTRLQAWSLLIDGVDQSSCCRLLQGHGSARTLLTLEKLFDKKKAELFRNEKQEISFSNGKPGGHKLWNAGPLLVFKAWLTMPSGHYGTPEVPTLDVAASAEYVGCDETTILNNLRDKAIPDWSRDGGREILTFTISDLDDLKGCYADGNLSLMVAMAAEEYGWDKQKMAKAILRKRKSGKLAGAQGIAVNGQPIKRRSKAGGRSGDAITRQEFDEFKKDIQERKRKSGFATQWELAIKVEAKDVATRHEVKECINLWYELGKLPGEQAIVETTVNARRSGRAISLTRTLDLMTYDEKKFLDLWDKTCSARVGKAHLAILLPFGVKRPVVEVDAEMRAKGFVGRRLFEAKRLAGAKTSFGDGQGPGDCKICERERIKPSKKAPPGPIEILKAILLQGPVLSEDNGALCKRAGIRQWELYPKMNRLGAKAGPIHFGGPWFWYLGEKPTDLNNVQRLGTNEAPLATARMTEPQRRDTSRDISKNHRKGPYKGAKVVAIVKAVKKKLKAGSLITEACQDVAEERHESFESIRKTFYRYR